MTCSLPNRHFSFFAQVKEANTLDVSWQIAEGYYLYRDKIRFEIDNPTLRIADFQIPTGQSYHDEAFGDVQIFYQTLNFTLPLQRTQLEPQNLVLTAYFQGCAERGVCYPPMQKKSGVEFECDNHNQSTTCNTIIIR